ncbi:MAG: glycoside hydrolase family 16 protein [Clostridiales bacterium]|jgi:beta-glucanase (GH16 family)|nr:glycoside hydrolase family 16 protein [Clostridiales bacterium]
MKKGFKSIILFIAAAATAAVLSGCSLLGLPLMKEGETGLIGTPFNTVLPDFYGAGKGAENANQDGWYEVFVDEFDGDSLNADLWAYSPERYRTKTLNPAHPEYTSYWTRDAVSVNGGNLEIRAEQRPDGRYTGGIETRKTHIADDGETIVTDSMLFEQAFGYFEVRVKFPDEEGLWSAFWLQSEYQRKIGNDGRDGTEIDVYESGFIRHPKWMGHALLWDGYGTSNSRVSGLRRGYGANLYDGYHTFALKWTPGYYVFYIDGAATWATNDGGVAQVAEFLRLTVEIDEGDGWGPHAQKIGLFKSKASVFYVDYVRVYQNVNYLPYIRSNDDYADIGAIK